MAAVSSKDVTKMSDEEIESEMTEMASLRTAVRLRQNDLQAEWNIRSAVNQLPADAQRVIKLRLNGGISPSGDLAQGGQK